jgi:hypothetical protein
MASSGGGAYHAPDSRNNSKSHSSPALNFGSKPANAEGHPSVMDGFVNLSTET